MKSIKIDVKFPSSAEVRSKLDTVLKEVQKNAVLDFTIDTKAFSASLNEMASMLAKLKSQLGQFNILEQVDTSKVDATKVKVSELGDEVEKFNKKISNVKTTENAFGEVTSQLNTYKNNIIQTTTEIFNQVETEEGKILEHTSTVINKNFEKFDNYISKFAERIGKLSVKGAYSDSAIADLQKELDTINTKRAVDQVEVFDKKLKNLENNSTSINKVKDVLLSANREISNVGKELSGFAKEADFTKARTEAYKLSNILSDLQSGKQLSTDVVNDAIKSATNSVHDLRNNAEDTKKLLDDLSKTTAQSRQNNATRNRNDELKQAQAVNKALEEEYKLNQKVIETIEKKKEASAIKNKKNETQEIQKQAQAINKALEEEYKLNQKVIDIIERKKEARLIKNNNDETKDAEKQAQAWNKALEAFYKFKEEAQAKMTNLVQSGTFGDYYLKELQSQFDSLNTNSSEKEIYEFNEALKDMIRLQKDVQTMGSFNEKTQNNRSKEMADWEKNQQYYIDSAKKAEAQIQAQREKLEQETEARWLKNLHNREQQEKATAQRIAQERIAEEQRVNDWWQKALFEREQKQKDSEKQLAQDKLALQQRISTLYDNGLIDSGAVDKLQEKLNKITTANAKTEVKNLNTEIGNIETSQSSVVKLEKEIDNLYNKLKANKNKYGELIKLDDIKRIEAEIQKLEQMVKDLRAGKLIDGDKISSETNKVKSSLDKVITSAKSTSSALKLTNKDAMSMGQALQTTLSKFGIYATSAMAIRKLFTEFKQGVEDVKALDSAMTTLKITMDGMTSKGLSNLTTEVQELATRLSSTTTSVLEAVTTFANAGETLDTIMNKTGSAVILSNLTGLDTQSTVDTIQSATMQFEALADGSEESAMKVVDSMVAISKAMGLDFTVGVKGMSDSLNILGSLAEQAKMDIDETLAVIGSGMEKLRMSGSEIATSMKTVIARTMRVADGEAGSEDFLKAEKALASLGIAIRDNEGNMRAFMDIMQDLNGVWDDLTEQQQIYVSDAMGGARQLSIVLSSIKNMDRTNELTDIGRNSLGSALEAQAQWAETLEAKLQSLTNTVQIFWQNFLSSDVLKGGVDLANNFMKALSGITDTFGGLNTSVMAIVGSMIVFNTKFRESATIISNGIIPITGKWTASLNKMGSSLNAQRLELQRSIDKVREYGITYNNAGMSTRTFGTSLVMLQGKLALTTAGLIATKVATIALQTALSMGLSLVITTVISSITKWVSSLDQASKSMKDCEYEAQNLTTALDQVAKERDLTNQYKKIQKELENQELSQERINELSNQLESVKSSLIGSENAYYGVLENENLLLDEQLEKMKRIQEQKLFETAKELDNAMLTEKEVNKKIKDLESYANKYNEIKSAIRSGNDYALIDLIGVADVNEAKNLLDDLQNKIRDLDYEVLSYNSDLKQLQDANYKTERSEKSLSDTANELINSFNAETRAIKENTEVKEANASLDASESTEAMKRSAEELLDIYQKIGYSVDDLSDRLEEVGVMSFENQTRAIVADSTQAYSDAKNAVQDLRQELVDLNEEGEITPQIMQELIDKYPEILQLGTAIEDMASVQEFLNNQIAEQTSIQSQAYQQMIADDQEYYEAKLKNNAEFQDALNSSINAMLGVSSSAYEIDLNNFSSLNELKNAIQNEFSGLQADSINQILDMYCQAYTFDSNNFADLQSMKQGYVNGLLPALENWINQMVSGFGDGYSVDLSNFNDLAQAKASVIQQLSQKMAELQAEWNKVIQSYNSAVQQAYANGNENKAMELESQALRKASPINSKINTISATIKTINKVFDDFDAKLGQYTASFTGGNFTGSVGSGSGKGSGSGSGSGSNKKDTEKEVADLEDLTDRYYALNDILEDINNLLDLNKAKQESAHGAELQKLLREEIALLGKKKEALSNLLVEYEKEQAELKKSLQSVGVNFDAYNNITNYNDYLTFQRNWANSLTGTAKEEAIEGIEAIHDAMDRFLELANDKIPNLKEEWESLVATINNNAEDMLKTVRDKLAKAIKEAREEEKQQKIDQLDDRIKKLREEIKALEDEDEDKQKKLLKLQSEYDKWANDDSVNKDAPYVEKSA